MTYLIDNSFYNSKVQRYSTSSRQDLTTTFADALGSEISYIPHSLSQKVIYSYTTSWTYKDITSKINFRALEYDSGQSTWVVIPGAYMTIKSLKSGSDQVCLKFLLDVWSGSKQLKIECKESSSSLEGYLHSNINNTHYFDPIVSCTGV